MMIISWFPSPNFSRMDPSLHRIDNWFSCFRTRAVVFFCLWPSSFGSVKQSKLPASKYLDQLEQTELWNKINLSQMGGTFAFHCTSSSSKGHSPGPCRWHVGNKHSEAGTLFPFEGVTRGSAKAWRLAPCLLKTFYPP